MPSPSTNVARRYPFGAELLDGGAHLRVWALACRGVEAEFEDGSRFELSAEPGGFFSGFCAGRRAGDRYQLRLDGGERLPDPASRFQPEGPHGPSELVDPAAFAWTDAAWKGLSPHGQVLYELHVGTFTREGT